MGNAVKNGFGLTERQELFVVQYVITGGNGTQAAIAAGYSDSSSHTRAYNLLKMPKIQSRMAAIVREHMSSHVPACLDALAKLAVSAQSESVKLQAACSLLDRTGYKVPIKVELEDHRTQADVDRELSILLGLEIQDESLEEVH